MPPLSSPEAPVVEKKETTSKPQQPPRYKVVLHNDDFTPFEFVIGILQEVFKKTLDEAEALAITIHLEGKGVCGVFVRDIAEDRQERVMEAARQEQYPLLCEIEPESPQPGGRGMKM